MKSVGDIIFLRGDGSLNARNCDEFKHRIHTLVQEGVKAVHLDLANCTYMDSTFLGLLVGLHKRVRQLGGHGLTVFSPSGRAREHLSSMGIDKLVQITATPADLPSGMDFCSAKPTESPRDILAAHKHLMDLSPENRKRFKILAQVLEQQIQQKNA